MLVLFQILVGTSPRADTLVLTVFRSLGGANRRVEISSPCWRRKSSASNSSYLSLGAQVSSLTFNMSSWNQFSSSHGGQQPRRPQSKPQLKPPQAALSSPVQGESRSQPDIPGKKERSATKFKSGYWKDLTVRFGKDRDFATGFSMQAGDSRLSLLDHQIDT